MEPMTLDELMNYWLDKAEDIVFDKSLYYKDRYYQFLDAYTTYLFYHNATGEFEEEAKEEATSYVGLTDGIFD